MPSSPGETLGERIRQARERRGWTQRALAAYLSRTPRRSLSRPCLRFSVEIVSRYESGKHKPQRPTLFALARLLRCSVAWLEKGAGS